MACQQNRTLSKSVKQSVKQQQLIDAFILSRRQGLSQRTIKNYRLYLRRSSEVVGISISGQELQRVINTRECTLGGQHAYYRCLHAFYTRAGERMPRHSRGTTVLEDRSDVIWEIEPTSDQDITILRRHKLRGLRKEMAKEYRIQFDRETGICVSVSKRGEHADFVRRKRLDMKLTQEEFGKALGVTGRQVRNWEAGVHNPSESVIKKLRDTD